MVFDEVAAVFFAKTLPQLFRSLDTTTLPADDLPKQPCKKRWDALLHCTVVLHSFAKKNVLKNSSLHMCGKAEIGFETLCSTRRQEQGPSPPQMRVSQVMSPPVTVEVMECSKCFTLFKKAATTFCGSVEHWSCTPSRKRQGHDSTLDIQRSMSTAHRKAEHGHFAHLGNLLLFMEQTS